jgi:hypothetical protein
MIITDHQQRARAETHCSITDRDAMLARKSRGIGAVLAYRGRLLTENRNGLVVSTLTTRAYGSGRTRCCPFSWPNRCRGDNVSRSRDKGYNVHDFIAELRHMEITPHVAQNDTNRRSAVDERTTRHVGYQLSQKERERIEEVFGWMKSIGLLRKLRHRGLERVGWMFTFTAAAYNLVRIRNLMRGTPWPQCVSRRQPAAPHLNLQPEGHQMESRKRAAEGRLRLYLSVFQHLLGRRGKLVEAYGKVDALLKSNSQFDPLRNPRNHPASRTYSSLKRCRRAAIIPGLPK